MLRIGNNLGILSEAFFFCLVSLLRKNNNQEGTLASKGKQKYASYAQLSWAYFCFPFEGSFA